MNRFLYNPKVINSSIASLKLATIALTTPFIFLIGGSQSYGQELSAKELPAEKKAASIIKEKGKDHLAVGNILVHKKSLEMRFPVQLGDSEDVIEYLLVADYGKTHETLLLTNVSAYHLNIAFKLAGYKESKELFRVLDSSSRPTSQFHMEKEEVKAAARFHLFLTWKESGIDKEVHVNELIENRVTRKHARIRPFVYSGSYLAGGNLQAHQTGNIIAILTDPTSLANFSNKGHEDDTLWYPFKKALPPRDADLTLVIKKTIPEAP